MSGVANLIGTVLVSAFVIGMMLMMAWITLYLAAAVVATVVDVIRGKQ